MKLPKVLIIAAIVFITLFCSVVGATAYKNHKKLSELSNKTDQITKNQTNFDNFSKNFDKELYRDQLQFQQKMLLEAQLAEIEEQIKNQPTTESTQAQAIEKILSLIDLYKSKSGKTLQELTADLRPASDSLKILQNFVSSFC